MLIFFKNRPVRSMLAVTLIVALCAVVALYSLRNVRHTTTDAAPLYLLREAYSVILEKYVEAPDSKKLVLKTQGVPTNMP